MYVEISAQTRFSDFSPNGYMHFSRCLMYFEKARFIIAEDIRLINTLNAAYPRKDVQFRVAKADITYLEPVPVVYDSIGGLVVRTWIREPFISVLMFEQVLMDVKTETPFIRAEIGVAMVKQKEGLIRVINAPVRQCLEDYVKKLENGPRFL